MQARGVLRYTLKLVRGSRLFYSLHFLDSIYLYLSPAYELFYIFYIAINNIYAGCRFPYSIEFIMGELQFSISADISRFVFIHF